MLSPSSKVLQDVRGVLVQGSDGEQHDLQSLRSDEALSELS